MLPAWPEFAVIRLRGREDRSAGRTGGSASPAPRTPVRAPALGRGLRGHCRERPRDRFPADLRGLPGRTAGAPPPGYGGRGGSLVRRQDLPVGGLPVGRGGTRFRRACGGSRGSRSPSSTPRALPAKPRGSRTHARQSPARRRRDHPRHRPRARRRGGRSERTAPRLRAGPGASGDGAQRCVLSYSIATTTAQPMPSKAAKRHGATVQYGVPTDFATLLRQVEAEGRNPAGSCDCACRPAPR